MDFVEEFADDVTCKRYTERMVLAELITYQTLIQKTNW